MKQKVFGVVGWKNSGKTTMTVRIVEELVRRGWKVSTVKHAHHEFDIDHRDTDSWRHRQAGAGEVAIVSGKRWALMHELRDAPEPPLNEILERLAPCDIVIIEGYKREKHPKIEVLHTAALSRARLAPDDPAIVAVASADPSDSFGLPWFAIDAIPDIADFIEDHTGMGKRQS